VAGGDEAGRGAVIGPLVVGIVAVKKTKEKKFSKIGVRDSKMLSEKKREYLFDEIYSIAEEVKTYSITAGEINNAMNSNISLNELEAIHFARLIESIDSNLSKIYLDSPDVIADRFGRRIGVISKRPMNTEKGQSRNAVRIIAEHKADATYPVTSAASIIAKVTREREVNRIKTATKIDFGSGYPSDFKTLNAIKIDLKKKILMPYLRERWSTMTNIKQSRIKEFIKS
jgi:ribonuclease HII